MMPKMMKQIQEQQEMMQQRDSEDYGNLNSRFPTMNRKSENRIIAKIEG